MIRFNLVWLLYLLYFVYLYIDHIHFYLIYIYIYIYMYIYIHTYIRHIQFETFFGATGSLSSDQANNNSKTKQNGKEFKGLKTPWSLHGFFKNYCNLGKKPLAMLEKDVEYFILQRPLQVYVHFFFLLINFSRILFHQ